MKIDGAIFETPFTIRQVESHLVFGPISRHLSAAWLLLAGGLVACALTLLSTDKPLAVYLADAGDKLLLLFASLILLRLPRRQQAIMLWIAFKIASGLAALLIAAVGSALSFQRHEPDAFPLLLIGLIWLPGIEFAPRIVPYQRYVSIARLVLSLPVAYWGIRTGQWHF